MRLDFAEHFSYRKHFLYDTERAAWTRRNYSQTRHEGRALDLTPFLLREIRLRRHNSLLSVCLLFRFFRRLLIPVSDHQDSYPIGSARSIGVIRILGF